MLLKEISDEMSDLVNLILSLEIDCFIKGLTSVNSRYSRMERSTVRVSLCEGNLI